MSPHGVRPACAQPLAGARVSIWQMVIVIISGSQERNLDWFPRMRAMSLVSSDSEGEQNELRNLQEKLESTMKLVSNLSGQLSELKDQVRESGLRTCGHALLRAGKGPASSLYKVVFYSSVASANPMKNFAKAAHV